MRLVHAPRRLGIDTVMDTRPYLSQLWDAGVRTILRYIRRPQNPPSWLQMITREEADAIIEHGFCLSLVQQGVGGWADNTGLDGLRVGTCAAEQAADLAVPHGVTLWCDCEWSKDVEPPKSGQTAYVEAWAKAVREAGYRAGLYVGASLDLNGDELYALKNITAYWASASWHATPRTRGWQVIQSLEYFFNGETFVGWDDKYMGKPGLRCDLDMCCIDSRGHYLACIGA